MHWTALRDEGVLIIGSGSITHNLRELEWDAPADTAINEYVPAFQQWVYDKLLAGEQAALLDYRKQAPGAQRAHPTDEHYLPLYVALGAAGPDAKAERLHTGPDQRRLGHGCLRVPLD